MKTKDRSCQGSLGHLKSGDRKKERTASLAINPRDKPPSRSKVGEQSFFPDFATFPHGTESAPSRVFPLARSIYACRGDGPSADSPYTREWYSRGPSTRKGRRNSDRRPAQCEKEGEGRRPWRRSPVKRAPCPRKGSSGSAVSQQEEADDRSWALRRVKKKGSPARRRLSGSREDFFARLAAHADTDSRARARARSVGARPRAPRTSLPPSLPAARPFLARSSAALSPPSHFLAGNSH